MFGSLGGPELILILIIALIVFGPKRLPDIGRSVGKMLFEFRKASTDFQRTIEQEVETERAKDAAKVKTRAEEAADRFHAQNAAAAEPAALPASGAEPAALPPATETVSREVQPPPPPIEPK